MTKIKPFHTNSPEYPPEDREVFHDHDECPLGKRIEQRHHEPGPGGKLRCEECAKFD